MKKLLQFFNLKPTHFIDGWATFDGISSKDIRNACERSNAKVVNLTYGILSMNILDNYPDITCFGKVSNNGDILILGISGFVMDNDCISYLRKISDKANKCKITDGSVFMEW